MESHRKYFDVESILYYFKSVFTAIPIKAIAASISVAISWVFNGEHEALISIYTLIVLDYITGVIASSRAGDLKSWGIYRTVSKCTAYFTMLVIGRIVDKHVPVSFAAPIMDTFLVMTESISILENIHKLGFPVPNKLVSMLKVYWDKEKDKE